jgi:hypothetical protein
LKLVLLHSLKIKKSHKEVKKIEEIVVFLHFFLVDGRIQCAQNHTDRIRNTAGSLTLFLVFLFRTYVTFYAVFSRGGAELLVDDHEREQQRRGGVQLRGHEPGRHGREECLTHLLPRQQLAR